MPSVLFAHDNFPAQFGGLGQFLAQKGWNVVFMTQNEIAKTEEVTPIYKGYGLVRASKPTKMSENGHSYLGGTEKAIRNGQGFAKTAINLKAGGFTPDVIMAHSGWGSGSFLKVAWPEAKFIQYLEWWYNIPAVDVPEDPSLTEIQVMDQKARALVRNLPFMLDMQQAHCIVAPTHFQASQIPKEIRTPVIVQHDGVDCDMHRPRENSDPLFTWDGLPDEAQIVTFATRGMEPSRGFPTFMEACEKLQKRHKDVHVVIAGEPTVHYSKAPADGYENWKEKALAELEFDMDRLHFTGRLARPEYAKLLQRSDAHTYLTRPFVLSWSFIEAMATGAPLIATDVGPICEALGQRDCARLVPLDDSEAVVSQMLWCLENPKEAKAMGQRAFQQARARYDKRKTMLALEKILLDAITAP
jgi:glycosyltransferase involved in cell wall biosynthesis